MVNRRGHTYPLTISPSPRSNSLSRNSQQENILKDKGNTKLHVLLNAATVTWTGSEKKMNKLLKERAYEECGEKVMLSPLPRL